MELIEISNGKVNLDSIIIWNYLFSNKNATLMDLENEFSEDKWKKVRKGGNSISSNLVYCIRRLKKIGAIEIVQNRHDGGKFDFASIIILKRPVIRNTVLLCVECGSEFKKKSQGSKYKDLCQDCTVKKFMTPHNSLCIYCKTYGTTKKMRSFYGDLYHQDCYAKYNQLKKEARAAEQAEKMSKKHYCTICNKTEIKKMAKFCKECLAEHRNKNTNIKNCIACNKQLANSNRSGRCDDDNCWIKYFIMTDAYFNARKKDNNNSSSIRHFNLKEKILGRECVVCGYDKLIQYHHVIFRENGGPDKLSNIVPICPNHHQEVHKLGLDISEYHKQVLQRIEDIKNGLITID